VNTPILDILHIPLTAIRGVSPYHFLSRHETPVNDLAGHQPGLIVLPAHDPTAAQRLLAS